MTEPDFRKIVAESWEKWGPSTYAALQAARVSYRAGQAASAERIKALEEAIDAARLEGIRLGLEAAKTHLTEGGWIPEISALDPATIAKGADQ